VKETVNFSARLDKSASPWHRGPMLEMVSSGSRIFRMNSALFSLWFLFPLLLIVTSDWIGLLVVFQALTAAVRLRALPAAKTLAAFSSIDGSSTGCERQCRAR
jgi:hypothetical protein